MESTTAPGFSDDSVVAAMGDTLAEIIDGVVAVEQMIAAASAWRARLLDQARQWSELNEQTIGVRAAGSNATLGPKWSIAERARRVVVSELAAATRMPERTVESMIADSQALVHDLPATLEALSAGRVSYRHAERIVDHAMSLPADARTGFEQAVVPFAETHTVAKLDRKARVLREQAHPESILQRHIDAKAKRCVSVSPARDGMAWLTALMTATDAAAVHDRLTDGALGLTALGDERTIDQLRTDILTDLLIDGVTLAGVGLGVRAQVAITVPVMTLLGHSDEPGHLEGHGPIDPDTARRLAGTATSFTRILTHPETGVVLSVSKEQFPVPVGLRRWLRVRDQTCRFVGCNRAARRCDLDHTIDRQYGGTNHPDNLAHLCEAHHRLKHETDWTVQNTGNGTLEWTSPSGRHYRTEPAHQIGGSGGGGPPDA